MNPYTKVQKKLYSLILIFIPCFDKKKNTTGTTFFLYYFKYS